MYRVEEIQLEERKKNKGFDGKNFMGQQTTSSTTTTALTTTLTQQQLQACTIQSACSIKANECVQFVTQRMTNGKEGRKAVFTLLVLPGGKGGKINI